MDKSRLTKLRLFLASLFALAAAGASAGQVTLFEGPGFQGDRAWTSVAVPDLEASQLEDGVSSAVVNDGTWEVCADIRFRGHCVCLVPGSYSRLGRDLNGAVMSVREIGDTFVAGLSSLPPDPPGALNQVPASYPNLSQIVINPGQAVVINLSSTPVVVNPSVPQVVAAAPQVIATPQPVVAMAPQVIATAPQVTATVPQVVAAPPVPAGRMVLYQFPNFAGPSAVVDHYRAPDLDWAHFSYPATSLRVESGRWLACSHIAYQGDCRVFGPGDYPALTGLLEQGIYSVRQIG